MSGVAILRELLALRAPLLELVPAARIVSGMLRQGAVLPAVSVHKVGDNEEATMARRGPFRMMRERVQVTVLARDWALMNRISKLADPGAGVHTGPVLGFHVNSILPMGSGPEIPPGDDGVHEISRDFMVTFLEAN